MKNRMQVKGMERERNGPNEETEKEMTIIRRKIMRPKRRIS